MNEIFNNAMANESSELGCLLGGVGLFAGAIGTIWGGYELGTIINDSLNISNSVARGALDLITMGILFPFSEGAGYLDGAMGGELVSITYDCAKDKLKDLKNFTYNSYNKIKKK